MSPTQFPPDNQLALDAPLDWISRDSGLPKVILYVTGGTILSISAYSRLDNLAYGEHVENLPAMSLVDGVPEVLDIAQIAIVAVSRTASDNLTSDCFMQISRHFAKHAGPGETDVAGGVIVHGTNTLAETMFGIDLINRSSKPLVACFSMRPQTGLSTDAFLNFYQAISVAVSPTSRNRGALIVGNDRISSVFYSTKVHANNPNTFMAMEQGHLGYLFAGQPHYFYQPAQPTGKHTFDLGLIKGSLPRVDIVYCHQEFEASLMHHAVDSGSKGLVLIGFGAGALGKVGAAATEELVLRGIPVVVAGRPLAGSSFPKAHPGFKINSNYLSGEKARMQLQLCLATGMGMEEIREVFEGPFRRAVFNEGTKFYNRTS